MRQATAAHIGRPMAILIDGEVVTTPTVRGAVSDSAWINGDYMRLLWTTRPGIIFLVTGAVLMVVGTIWARKTVKIDV